MEIKDLVGLSEPLKRLIDVVSNGIGAVSRPYLIKKTADAKAYELKVIAQAMTESQKLLPHSEYKDGKIKVISSDVQLDGVPALSDRVTARLEFKELHAQQNVEAVCANAAEELERESAVPDEKPDPEWISRFLDISAGISTDGLQQLWGRILAGEIKSPGSFSLRTLDVLRNLSKKEAESFVKLGNYILRSSDKVFYIDPAAFIFTKDGGLTFLDILALKDAGLIFESALEFSFNLATAGKNSNLFYGPLILLFERDKDTPRLASKIELLTKVGVELLQLITVQPDIEYVRFVGKCFHADGMRFAWASILQVLGDQVSFGHKTYAEL